MKRVFEKYFLEMEKKEDGGGLVLKWKDYQERDFRERKCILESRARRRGRLWSLKNGGGLDPLLIALASWV